MGFEIALVEPTIPQNTGNIGRIALAFGCRLHLVGKLGFSIDEKACRRAGLDYWKHVDLATWDDLDSFSRALPGKRLWLFSAHGKTRIHEADFRDGDALVFGNEQRGLGLDLVRAAGERSVVIPLATTAVRSLNLANAVSIGVYEASRRIGFPTSAASPEIAESTPEGGEPGRPSRRRGGKCARS
ncbi:MAG TPA: tRNA (cytidine(34)-2'-O)-methyltransferase [Planctomycetota bacterium]|nr:tRNA (cytidine(34)-2'-O)-methyltransferase [Planctomycetota bacterium]